MFFYFLKRRSCMVLICLVFCCQAFSSPSYGQDYFAGVFNSNMSPTDLKTLSEGKLLVRNIGMYKNIVLDPFSDGSKELRERIKKLNPSYLVEVVRTVPIDQAQEYLDRLTEHLADVESYKNIAYYSAYNKVWDMLYRNIIIKSKSTDSEGTNLKVYGEIYPFTPYEFDVRMSRTGNNLSYYSINDTVLQYHGFDCVGKSDFVVSVYTFQCNDLLVIYGIGGVNAPVLPIVKERIETSFINRIITFCTFTFTKL